MFEKELDRVRKQLKSSLASPQPYVPLSAILANEMVYAPYRRFFEAEVQWWVHEERVIRTSNPRFDTQGAQIGTLLKSVDAEYVAQARFDHEELTNAIDAAVKTRLNFLCRPRTTLKWFVFRGEPTKPIQEILLRLRYLYDYQYLLQGFESWVRARSTESSQYEILSVVEFERIVEKIDNDAILDLSQEEFVALMDPLFEFFGEANPELPPETVPTEAVIIFLDDKGAIPISQALERLLYREELRYLTRTKLIDIINDVIAQIEESAGSAQFPLPSTTTSESDIPFLSAPVISAVDEPADASLEEMLADTYEETFNEPIEDALELLTAETEPERATKRSDESETGRTSEVPPNPAPPTEVGATIGALAGIRRQRLETLIDASMRERIVRKLFDKQVDVYDGILRDVLTCATWKEAAITLDRRFAEHGVEPNASAAMEFAQALHRSFL